MSRSPIRRPRVAAPLLAAVVALGLLGGCAGQRDPGSYTDAVEANFIRGCVGTSKDDQANGDVSESANVWGRADCQCAYDAIKKATAVGAVGLVAGGVKDSDLTQFLGYEIGVAITGTEAIDLTMLVTEGFGYLNMAHRTFELLQSLSGKVASINGATQIRAGVIRPEIIAPLNLTGEAQVAGMGGNLDLGTAIRVIREPYFGQLGVVTDLPSQLMVVDSGTEVRVLKAKLEGGSEVLVPRANVEIIAT